MSSKISAAAQRGGNTRRQCVHVVFRFGCRIISHPRRPRRRISRRCPCSRICFPICRKKKRRRKRHSHCPTARGQSRVPPPLASVLTLGNGQLSLRNQASQL